MKYNGTTYSKLSNVPIIRHLFVTLEKVPNSRALWMSHFSDFSQKLLEKEKSKENLSFFSCFWVEFKGLSSNDNPFITNFQNGILDALDRWFKNSKDFLFLTFLLTAIRCRRKTKLQVLVLEFFITLVISVLTSKTKFQFKL